MKKHLIWLLTLLSVIALLVACTTGMDDTDTTAETPTVTDPATGAPTDPAETPTEEPTATPETPTEAPTDDVTEQPTEEATEPELVINGFAMDHERVEKQFSGANTMKAERVELDGSYVIKLSSTGASNDPFIAFNVKGYCTAKKIDKIKAEECQYIILRVKAENCSSAKFELFYGAGTVSGATGDCVLQASFDNSSTEWQYIVFNMKAANKWTGNINFFRFDYQLSTAGAGENMYISHIYFAKNDDEMRAVTQQGLKDPFEVVTDPEVEQKVEDLLATPDKAPALNNDKQNATNEDANLELWFNHAYINNPAEDVTSTGWNSYLLRMAKNESEGTHMFLVSKGGHNGLSISVTNFRNKDGVELKTELMYGYYFEDVEGKTLVDPIPWVQDGQTFDLVEGRSYMYIIKATSFMDSPAGEYTATVTVKDANGNEIKKATVNAYVWNFVLPEETSCKTQMDLSWYNIYYAHECWDGDDSLLYKNYYDLLLNNRVCAYTLPYDKGGYFTDSRIKEYLDNPRVTAFNPLGWAVRDNLENRIPAAYAFLSQKQEWLDKAYFYLEDEPGNLTQLNRINEYGALLLHVRPAPITSNPSLNFPA